MIRKKTSCKSGLVTSYFTRSIHPLRSLSLSLFVSISLPLFLSFFPFFSSLFFTLNDIERFFLLNGEIRWPMNAIYVVSRMYCTRSEQWPSTGTFASSQSPIEKPYIPTSHGSLQVEPLGSEYRRAKPIYHHCILVNDLFQSVSFCSPSYTFLQSLLTRISIQKRTLIA